MQFGIYSTDVEHEANLKIGEFFYHGVSGMVNYNTSVEVFKVVEDMSTSSELRSHALFSLGMIYQFGE